ncbi:hypothetical protein ANN_26563 [Periplaneta americana]|uniref:DUF4817 domain-containing protein n=1 Tax=Periplaneta americana TaxID=6978 RepID=A0ABQ8RYG9_PERAM|nr:hypothetical protein ANN_26563 [Periplaneta americana]
MYGKVDGNAALARRLYQERYPQRQCPDRKTFVRLHYRLCEYGKFNFPGLGRGRPRSTTPEVQDEILEAVNMTPSISTRRVALQVNVPHTTVWRLLEEYQLYPYHLQRVQALSPADYPARVRFCQWFLQQCGVNPNFPALVLFTDEAQFTRDGITNFQNQHVWASENPRATVPSHHQVRFSLNMWAGIIGDRLDGPHVLVYRLTGQAYTNFLENTILHVLEDTPLINRQHIHFLHDGAPAHFSRTARRYLDRRFPDRWIGQCYALLSQCIASKRSGNVQICLVDEEGLNISTSGNLNSNRYIREVLEFEVIPLLQTTPRVIFQQDNARSYVARIVEAFFEERRVVVFTEGVQNVHLLLEYRPHIDVSLTCEHDPKLQEY